MRTTEYEKVNFNINIWQAKVKGRKTSGNPHYHNAYEIQYFVNGEVTFFVQNQVYKAKKGDILFIDTHEIHHPTHCANEYEKVVVIYKPSFMETNPRFRVSDIFNLLNKKFGGTRLISLPQELQKKVESFFTSMIEHYPENSSHSAVCMNAYLTLLLSSILDFLNKSDYFIDQHAQSNSRISNIISFLDDNLTSQLSLEDISNHFCTNRFHLCRFFKKHTGLSIFDYINHRKIINAETLLIQNKYNITDICFMTGFNNLTHFERTFRKLTGMSPKNYRKENLVIQNSSSHSSRT